MNIIICNNTTNFIPFNSNTNISIVLSLSPGIHDRKTIPEQLSELNNDRVAVKVR